MAKDDVSFMDKLKGRPEPTEEPTEAQAEEETPEEPVEEEVKAETPETDTQNEAPEAEEAPAAEADKAEDDPKGEKQDTDEPPASESSKKHDVPVTALLDEREKRQEWQRKYEETQRQLDQLQAQRAAPEKPQDPNQMLQQQMIMHKLDMSKFHAERDHGVDLVKEAIEFYGRPEQNDIAAKLQMEPSPVHAAVEAYKRHQLMQKMGDDPEAYIEAQVKARLEEQAKAAPTPVPAPAKSASTPPPSTSKVATGGDTSPNPATPFFNRLTGRT